MAYKTKRTTEPKRVRMIRDKYGHDIYSKWGKKGGDASGGSPVLQDKAVMKYYYQRHPKKK